MTDLPREETLTCEFKSDRKCLGDKELIEAVTCMANSQGGEIYLGVEDDGTVSGLHPNHRDLASLAAMIANRTQPSVEVTVSTITIDGLPVACIRVPVFATPVATQDGVLKRRRLQANGKPECVPYLPHEFAARQAHFGLLDISSKPVAGATLADLDPVERARLRQFIQRFNGDQTLYDLDDAQLDAALGLTVRSGEGYLPSLTGLLLLGHESSLRTLLPTHEIAFQMLDGEEVRLNEFSRAPLLRAFEWLETLFKPLNIEKEFQAGLFRVAIPRLDSRAFPLLSGIFSGRKLKALRHLVERGKPLSANSTTGCRNMFRISRMQEILKGLPRGAFDRLVSEQQADKHSKGFGCWDQLVAMIYGHLSGAESLRQLEAGFNSQSNHHYHLGTGPVRRSTLAEANGRRGAEVFEQAARLLMGQASRQLRRESQELLYLLDSTSITLKGPGFDTWTQGNRTRNTQGIKLHLLYAAHEQIPLQHSFTAANVNDIEEGLKLPIETGATYVFDKGYCDYNWWAMIDARHARFVTRFKYNAALRIDTSRPIAAEDGETILEDQIVHFAYRHQGAGRRNRYEKPLRRIVVARPDKDRPLILATNDLDAPASAIAKHYKDRWQIELFFKWIKQHLKIKRFLGRSENAVRIQILCALISYLLLALYKKAHGFNGSLWMLLATARASLFQRPSLEVARDRKRREQCLAFSQRQPGLFA